MKKTILVSILISLLLGGCASSGYTDFYKSYATPKQVKKAKEDPDMVFLKDNEEPKIFTSNDLKKDILTFRSRGYRAIGRSSFNGGWEDKSQVIAQAKKVGAVLVIYSWKYTNSQTNSGALILPKTNYHSGTVYGSSGGYASYSGTSTGTTVIPYSNTQRRYDQEAIFFIKSNKKLKFGISMKDISREKRIEIGTSGVLVDVIMENSAAYNSNLLIGDIIIKMNGIDIQNRKQISQMMKDFDIVNNCILTVVRNGKEKDIEIKF